MTVTTLCDKSSFEDFVKKPGTNVVHFGAAWSDASQQLNNILDELGKELPGKFNAAYVDAENVPEVALEAKIEAAPTVIFYKSGQNVHRIDGFQPTDLRNAIITLQFSGETGAPGRQDLNSRLKELIHKARVTLFMKGDADQPRCGFSRKIVDLLKAHNVDFWSFDILTDEEVRQGLKKYSDWPTYPQLYLDGELLGGLDVVQEEFQNADFVQKLPKKV